MLVGRLVALEANHAAFKELLNERDVRYTQRSLAQDTAVAAALATSKEAVSKAEIATEKRLEALNELRAMAESQGRDFARTAEMKLLFANIDTRIDGISKLQQGQISHSGGIREALGWIFAGGAILVTVIIELVTRWH